MLEFAYVMIALAMIYLLASVWGQSTNHFGFVLIPLFAMIFWLVGWLPDIYVASTFPLLLGLGIISFLKEQFKVSFNVFGSSGTLIWKIMAFMIYLQFAMIFVTSIGAFNYNNSLQMPNTTVSNYQIANAGLVYGNFTTVSNLDQLTSGITLIWTIWNITLAMLMTPFTLWPTLILVFRMPTEIAVIISAMFYILLALEIFILIFRPLSAPGA